MAILDIVVIAVVVLFLFIGLFQGFMKSVIGLVSVLVSLLVAYFLGKYVANKLLGVGWIGNLVLGESGSLRTALLGILPASLETEGMLSGLVKKVIELVSKSNVAEGDIRGSIAALLASGIFTSAVCVVLFAAVRIVVSIFNKIAKTLRKNKSIRGADRLLGMVIGVAKAVVLVMAVFGLSSFFMNMSFLVGVKNDLDKSYIAKPLYEASATLANKWLPVDDWIKNLNVPGLEDILGQTGDDESPEPEDGAEEEPEGGTEEEE
ncbi:MAG: CvpA family protein [Clostridiales bacterium]|jgi:uncharacterized membrane protein required for colicin V production|nr:CvpA family protein [Clostridiales bacterium]